MTQMATKHALAQWLIKPTDAAALAVFRILFGLLMLWATIRFVANGWVHDIYLTTDYHFSYDWFTFIPFPSGPLLYLIFGIVGAAALAIALGLYTRVAAAIFFLGFTYIELLEKSVYLNHYYLVSLTAFLLIWLPSDRVWSLRMEHRSATIPRGVYALLQCQFAIVYLFAGIAKLNHDWLFRGEPLATWLGGMGHLPIVGQFLVLEEVAIVMSWLGALFDLTIVFFLMYRKTRHYAYAVAVVFHLMVWLLFPIGMFSFVMLANATLFLSPSWPRRWSAKIDAVPTVSMTPHGVSKKALILGVFWLLIQVVIPLRHLGMKGPVNWTEEGFRFSWRVMLIEKTGTVEFRVRTVPNDKTYRVHPRSALTPQQYRMLCVQPDMILQYARHLATTYKTPKSTTVEVYADAFVSYNGRPVQRYLSAEANLADPDITIASAIEPLRPSKPR